MTEQLPGCDKCQKMLVIVGTLVPGSMSADEWHQCQHGHNSRQTVQDGLVLSQWCNQQSCDSERLMVETFPAGMATPAQDGDLLTCVLQLVQIFVTHLLILGTGSFNESNANSRQSPVYLQASVKRSPVMS